MLRRQVLQAMALTPFANPEIGLSPTGGIRRLSTGFPALDVLMGGGYPCGHMTLLDGFCLSRLRKPGYQVRLGDIRVISPLGSQVRRTQRTRIQELLAEATLADRPLECWVHDDPRLEEYLGWLDGAQVPILLNGWMARPERVRAILHARSSIELVVEKYLDGEVVRPYVRVVANRLADPPWEGRPYAFERRPPDPKDGTTCELPVD